MKVNRYVVSLLIFLIGLFFLYKAFSQNQTSDSHSMNMHNGASMHMAMSGDASLRYSVNFNHPDVINPNESTRITFQIYNAANGTPISLLTPLYTKQMHMIIVTSDLTYYSHIHPQLENGKFVIDTTFPKADLYHIYIDFQPLGAREQQFAFVLPVGGIDKPAAVQFSKDTNATKVFGQYEVTLKSPKPLTSAQISNGEQLLTIQDAKTKQPIKTLKPYLGAFGHLVLINAKTFDYIHVHPNNLTPPKPDQNSGPNVSFMPMSLYGPIKPGIYRAFAQFNPDNKLFTADFTIKIE